MTSLNATLDDLEGQGFFTAIVNGSAEDLRDAVDDAMRYISQGNRPEYSSPSHWRGKRGREYTLTITDGYQRRLLVLWYEEVDGGYPILHRLQAAPSRP